MRTKMPLSKEIIALSKLPWFPQIMRELGYEPVRHGQWYDEPNYLGTSMTMYFCSECGSGSHREDPYCWHCGAKMDVSDTDVGKMEEEEE